jgi:protein-S-isoprenylcysteine O-methyltransferase Ste14
MRVGTRKNAAFTVAAVALAVALTFGSVELPLLLNRALQLAFGGALFPHGIWSGPNEAPSEVYIQKHFLRPIGYACLIGVLVLIVLGLVAERRRMAAAGAMLFFLPVFGHFAVQMFFLAGLGLLRLIWMPILDGAYGLTGDSEFWIFRLGDVAFLPYMGIVYLGALAHLDLRLILSYIIMGIGLFLFSLAVVAWLRSKWLRQGTAESWVYRFSRHPQYLGWIIWSYGLFVFFIHHNEGSHFQIGWGIPDSLPWLVSTMVIVGVALLEEVSMRRERGNEYEAYAARTPFMFPLPGLVSSAVALPMRLVLRKKRPERGAEVAAVVLLYLILLMLASWLVRARGLPPGRVDLYPY